ncbi:hypothetical protein JCM4914_74950 [Streptomyces platensis subsp. malvinus]
MDEDKEPTEADKDEGTTPTPEPTSRPYPPIRLRDPDGPRLP